MTRQEKSELLNNERLLSTSKVLRKLNTTKRRLDYLFESQRLKREDFLTLQNGHRVYRQSDLNKIKQALFEVSAR